MYQAFPGSDYYGGSVTVGLAPLRRSRICTRETLSTLRLPVRFLTPFIAGYSPLRAFCEHSTDSHIRGVAASGMLRRAVPCAVGNLSLASVGLAIRTGLAGTTALHTFGLPRFTAMLVSPLPFGARLGGCPRRSHCSQPPAPQERSHVRRNGALLRRLRRHASLDV
jgi:hypothetical protein